MGKKKSGNIKIGWDAKTGKFIPVKEAERRKSTTVVVTIRKKIMSCAMQLTWSNFHSTYNETEVKKYVPTAPLPAVQSGPTQTTLREPFF